MLLLLLCSWIIITNSDLVQDVAWLWFGKTLAIANFLYFSFNLFGFLIPRFLPRAFERYFKERDEVYFKMAEDKPTGDLAAQPTESKVPETKKADWH